MRADRLINMILILQNRSRVTAAELAKELEVSVRTIYRDIVALSSAGVPVYTEKGPGGGIRLVENYKTTLTGLSAEEAQSLFMLNVPDSMGTIGVGKNLENAFLKLAAALPFSLQHIENDVRQRVLIDAEYVLTERNEPASFLINLYQAVWEDRCVRISIRYMNGLEQTQKVDPYSLVASGGKWFLIGKINDVYWSVSIDRILRVEKLDQVFERDDSFDLRTYWRDWKYRMGEDLYPYIVTVLIDERLIDEPVLFEDVKIIDKGVPGKQKAGWVRMMVGFGYLFKARAWAMQLGGAVQIIDPEPLRRTVLDYARQILEVHEHWN